MKRNSFRWKYIIRVAMLGLIAFAFSGFFYIPSWQEMSLTFVEALIYLIFFTLLFSFSPIRKYFAKIPVPHKLILITFFILLLIGQFINDPRLTFPFTSWAMYGRPEHPETLVFYRYQGFDDKQNKIDISPEDLLPPIGKSAVASKFKNLLSGAFSNEDKAKQKENEERLKELLLAFGEIYNRSYPEHPIRSVELIQCSLNLRDRGKSDILRQSLWRGALESRSLQ